MSQSESNPGTGVKEVIDLLLKAPQERLCSLILKLGTSREEEIVHALCLFILHREEQALEKLHAQQDNVLVKNLTEKWQRRQNIEAFQVLCGHFQESESLKTLARIFKVLTQHGLCDRVLLNLAYKRALPRESSDSDVLEYDRFIEEAKAECGPELAEFLCTAVNNLKLVSGFPSKAEVSATTGSAQDLSKSDRPTTLQSTSSVPSFPSELEISAPPTYKLTNTLAPPLDGPITRSRSCPGIVQPQSYPTVNPYIMSPGQSLQFPTFPYQKPELTSTSFPSEAAAKEDTEEDEVKFYSFVILHAQEDEDVAENLREKLESITKSQGATFSGEFAKAGYNPISCVDDAINNSAFTLPLLTTNFNRFLEVKTNTALLNAIENRPKYNTVVPLLPASNAMPREDRPMVLKTLIPLDESKHFERKSRQTLSQTNIRKQRDEWEKEQREKRRKERQEKLKISNQQQQREYEENREMFLLEQEHLRLWKQRYNFVPEQMVRPDGTPWVQQQHPQQQQPHINITNAKYIIIGDNSQMAVDLGNTKAEHKEET